jgi:hypothetical protein
MNAPIRNRFEIFEAVDTEMRNDIYRFRYRIYVEQMGRRQKYADHASRRIVEPLDEAARIYAAYLNGAIVGTIRGNRFSDSATAYYRRLYRIDDRFPFDPDEMSLTTKLMFEPTLRGSLYPIRLIVHYARDFNAQRACKIDFLDCNRRLLPFFLKLGYVDYLGWVFHSEYGTVRPLFCPADQVLRLQQLRSPLAAIARDLHDDNMFGGVDLIRSLALVENRAAQPARRLSNERWESEVQFP